MVIGLSIFAGAAIRSGATNSYTYGVLTFHPLDPQSWNVKNQTDQTSQSTFNLWGPRDLRIEIKTNSTLNVYLLDEAGLRLWASQGELEPIYAFEEIQQQVVSVQIPFRGNYGFLVYNPTESMVGYEINSTLYGFEKDLLWASILFIALGAIIVSIAGISSILTRKPKHTNRQG
jgi:hypothetical protein